MNNISFTLLLLCLGGCLRGQANTAVTGGSIGKCAVWGYPGTLYNTAAATQTVNSGITVNVDQNRNIGAVNLNGSGAVAMTGSNGITLSGSGTEINCRWDIKNYGSNTVLNNNGVFSTNSAGEPSISKDLGTFFSAPYAGIYRWVMGSGWAANMSGAYRNGGVGIKMQGNDYVSEVFFQFQAGSCGKPYGSTAPDYAPQFISPLTPITLYAGQTLSYGAYTSYSSDGTCNNTQLFFTVGTATVFYEN